MLCFVATAMAIVAAEKKIITFDGFEVGLINEFICFSRKCDSKFVERRVVRARDSYSVLLTCRTQRSHGRLAMTLSWF